MNVYKTVTIALIIAGVMLACPLFSQEQPADAASGKKPAEVQPPGGEPVAQEALPAVPSALSENLKGLKKAAPGDLDPNKQIILNPDVMPIFAADGKRLQGKDFMDAIMSGGFVPEPYIDDKKDVKAFVLRTASEEEKRQILSMMEQETDRGNPAGKDAKPFSVTDLKGKKYSLEKLKGKVIVINFWFLECKPCRMEIPELNKIVEGYKGKDVVFLGMSTNRSSQLEPFLAKTEFKYNIIPESGMIAATYGVTGFPTHMVIDKDSKITYFASGFGPGTVEKLKSEIDRLLKK